MFILKVFYVSGTVYWLWETKCEGNANFSPGGCSSMGNPDKEWDGYIWCVIPTTWGLNSFFLTVPEQLYVFRKWGASSVDPLFTKNFRWGKLVNQSVTEQHSNELRKIIGNRLKFFNSWSLTNGWSQACFAVAKL